MSNRSIAPILSVLFLYTVAAVGQNPTLWIGHHLTEVAFNSGKWFYTDENGTLEIKQIDGRYFGMDELTDTPIYELEFEQPDPNLDTIRLHSKLTTKLFTKTGLAGQNHFKFYSFEFDVLDPFGRVKAKYHLNKYGLFRKSNERNETLVEKYVEPGTLDKFEKLWKRIDVQNMDKAYGRRNFCDNDEYSFTFWNSTGRRLNYTSMYVRSQLVPVRDFVVALAK